MLHEPDRMRCKQSDVYIPLAAWHLSLTSTIGALRISCIPGPHGIQKKTSSRYTRFLRNRWDRPSPCVVCQGWLRQECRQTTQNDRLSPGDIVGLAQSPDSNCSSSTPSGSSFALTTPAPARVLRPCAPLPGSPPKRSTSSTTCCASCPSSTARPNLPPPDRQSRRVLFRSARARSGAPPMRTSTGFSTEAVYIFNNMLRKLSKQYGPAYLAAIFESAEPTHRVREFPEYKANRVETPPDLLDQIPFVRRILEAMRIPILEYPGFEADDVIGPLARRAEALGMDVVIVSSDKDMLQLVNDHVSMLNPAKDDEWYDAEKVKAFLGVRPDQVADLLALKGDAVDNIPGAPGIGDKGAKDLIERFGSLDAALERAAEVEKKAYRESLQNNVERIKMSQRLATIATDVPVEFSAEAVKAQAPDAALLKAIYKEMEFHSLLKELGPSEDTRGRQYKVVASSEELRAWLTEARGAPVAVAISKSAEGEFALDTIGLAWRAGEARAVHAEHFAALSPWLEDAGAVKVACDVKAALLALSRLGIEARGFLHDVMLYAFLLDADPGGCALPEQARQIGRA